MIFYHRVGLKPKILNCNPISDVIIKVVNKGIVVSES